MKRAKMPHYCRLLNPFKEHNIAAMFKKGARLFKLEKAKMSGGVGRGVISRLWDFQQKLTRRTPGPAVIKSLPSKRVSGC